MSHIFANVRKNSKYASQAKEEPFLVSLDFDTAGYHWKGGPGGQYRSDDLHFYLNINAKFVEVELCNFGGVNHLEISKQEIFKGLGKDWHSSYWYKIMVMSAEILEHSRAEYEKQCKAEAELKYSEDWD